MTARASTSRRRDGVALTALIAALLAASAPAAPPPGHPTTEQAGRLLNLEREAGALPFSGRVAETIDSNAYTYVRVEGETGSLWLVVPRLELPIGRTIRYPSGASFSPFYSRKLQRNFERVLFVKRVELVGD